MTTLADVEYLEEIERQRELQASPNGQGSGGNKWAEKGTAGLQAWGGWVQKAYAAELRWPTCEPLFSRIYRSNPEVTIVRNIFTAWAGHLRPYWEVETDKPTDDDKRAIEFAESVIKDIDGGGLQGWYADAMPKVPMHGFGLWNAPPAVRRKDWRPPDDDPWRSNYDDGLIGIRRLAFRDYSSWFRWQMNDKTGRVTGFEQNDPPNPITPIPLNECLHITYGDHNNPEGLALMEAIWRLERLLYGGEVVMFTGFERAAGYLEFEKTVAGAMTSTDTTNLRAAARAVWSAQEGNFLTVPYGFKATMMDVPFSAGPALREVLKDYRILMLSLLGMQWVALSSMSGAGSYAAMDDSSSMAVLLFNGMADDFTQQIDAQIGRRLFDVLNHGRFPGMTARPRLKVKGLDKAYPLPELGTFVTALNAIRPLGDDDLVAIRQRSGFLPETLPEVDEVGDTPMPEGTPTNTAAPDNLESTAGLNGAQIDAALRILEGLVSGATPPAVALELLIALGIERGRAERIVNETAAKGQAGITGEMSQSPRPFVVSKDDLPTDVEYMANDVTDRVDAAVRGFEAWAEEHDPEMALLLRAKVEEADASQG